MDVSAHVYVMCKCACVYVWVCVCVCMCAPQLNSIFNQPELTHICIPKHIGDISRGYMFTSNSDVSRIYIP